MTSATKKTALTERQLDQGQTVPNPQQKEETVNDSTVSVPSTTDNPSTTWVNVAGGEPIVNRWITRDEEILLQQVVEIDGRDVITAQAEVRNGSGRVIGTSLVVTADAWRAVQTAMGHPWECWDHWGGDHVAEEVVVHTETTPKGVPVLVACGATFNPTADEPLLVDLTFSTGGEVVLNAAQARTLAATLNRFLDAVSA